MKFVWPAKMFRRQPRPGPVVGSQFPHDPFFNDPRLRAVMRVRNLDTETVRHLILLTNYKAVAFCWVIEDQRFEVGELLQPR